MYKKIGFPQASTFAGIIKALSIISGALIVGFGITGMIFMIMHDLISSKFFLIFSPVFIVLFGFAMIGVEFKVGFIMDNFDFLTTLAGKGIFYIYLSSSVFFFFTCEYSEVVLAWICSMTIFGLGIIFIILNFSSTGYGKEVKEQLN